VQGTAYRLPGSGKPTGGTEGGGVPEECFGRHAGPVGAFPADEFAFDDGRGQTTLDDSVGNVFADRPGADDDHVDDGIHVRLGVRVRLGHDHFAAFRTTEFNRIAEIRKKMPPRIAYPATPVSLAFEPPAIRKKAAPARTEIPPLRIIANCPPTRQ